MNVNGYMFLPMWPLCFVNEAILMRFFFFGLHPIFLSLSKFLPKIPRVVKQAAPRTGQTEASEGSQGT